MLLSVVVYNHKLTAGQWVGTGIVFAGISVEALVKRKGEHPPLCTRSQSLLSPPEIHAKRVAQEKEMAKIKEL